MNQTGALDPPAKRNAHHEWVRFKSCALRSPTVPTKPIPLSNTSGAVAESG